MSSPNRKIAVEGARPDGSEFREMFNSYYLAVCRKQELIKKGYSLKIVEPVGFFGYSVGPVKYSKQEKEEINELRPRHKVRVYRSNFK